MDEVRPFITTAFPSDAILYVFPLLSVTAGPPADNVSSDDEMPAARDAGRMYCKAEFWMSVAGPTVMTGAANDGAAESKPGGGMVDAMPLEMKTVPDEPAEIDKVTPALVTAGPPGDKVWPLPRSYWDDESGDAVVDSRVRAGIISEVCEVKGFGWIAIVETHDMLDDVDGEVIGVVTTTAFPTSEVDGSSSCPAVVST